MAEELTPTELAALTWRQAEKRLREHPCSCKNCEWMTRLLVQPSGGMTGERRGG